nr:carcinoembryonic antigen-related cell adhesion molecule 1-like isoform X2 [Camelus dromedarius]
MVYFRMSEILEGQVTSMISHKHKSSDSNHSQGHSDNSPSKIDKVAYSSLNFNVQESKKPTSASPSLTASETVYSEVKKK